MNEEVSTKLMGRKKIFTDKRVITKNNIVSVLQDALMVHNQNKIDIAFLLNFEKGEQPLKRKKTVRPEINIESISNIANEITEFKLGYFWGNPIAIVQKSDKLPSEKESENDNSAISILNDMYFAEMKDSKDQQLARYIEICGIGYQMIDIKRNPQDGDSPFDLITLNPLYSFVVYYSGIGQIPVMGVTYTETKDGCKYFTCYTADTVYVIDYAYRFVDKKTPQEKEYFFGKRNGEKNPLGEVPIIEFERSFDRTGCFERQVKELNALNIMESDLVNDISQTAQAIWWGNDIKLDEDDTGKPKGVQAGQWLLTQTTGQNNKPGIQALVLQYDYAGVLSNIQAKHDYILERAFVPKQSDPGGGSTGTAMSLSSGWSAAESVACKEALVVKKSFQIRNKLVLKAIKKSFHVEPGNPVLKLSANDIEIRFIRQKTFDLSTKVNALSTLLNCMVEPRTAMSTVDLFSNLAEAVDDSYENMKKYQENMLKTNSKADAEGEITKGNDLSAQTQNSPILDK